MVHVVYLGAASNGGSWERMHKALLQNAWNQCCLSKPQRQERTRESDAKIHTNTCWKSEFSLTVLRFIFDRICLQRV